MLYHPSAPSVSSIAIAIAIVTAVACGPHRSGCGCDGPIGLVRYCWEGTCGHLSLVASRTTMLCSQAAAVEEEDADPLYSRALDLRWSCSALTR